MAEVVRVVRVGAGVLFRVTRASAELARRCPRWCTLVALAAVLAVRLSRPGLVRLCVVAWMLPLAMAAAWVSLAGSGWDRVVACPARSRRWRWWLRSSWPALIHRCGVSIRVGEQFEVPELVSVASSTGTLSFRVRALPGQSSDDLEGAAPELAAAADAVSIRSACVSSAVVEFDMVLRADLAAQAATVPEPSGVDVDALLLGRSTSGSEWRLTLRGRHTLVVGCSGAGKGSLLWGVCGGLAPQVAVGRVQLWGIDLKRGVEIGMGASLFHVTAYTPAAALSVLAELLGVIDARGTAMVGRSRLHEPTPGDPLHVLVIDELAALVAYADPDTRREASRMLAEVLTQGRALGVVVVAMVQDPRKEVVGQRGLFTQTVALRLRSADETRMVLGEGMAARAPVHKISPAAPGTGYVVGDDGVVDLVRAHWWTDELVGQVADRYGSVARVVEMSDVSDVVVPAGAESAPEEQRPRRVRSPRRARALVPPASTPEGET